MKRNEGLPQRDQQYLVITALGRDRAGIVNAITRHAGECDCNIEDSRLAIFGEEFTFIMMLSGSWNAIAMLEATLPVLAAELDLLTVMKRTQRGHQPAATTGVSAQVTVPDAAGLVERFTNLFMRLITPWLNWCPKPGRRMIQTQYCWRFRSPRITRQGKTTRCCSSSFTVFVLSYRPKALLP